MSIKAGTPVRFHPIIGGRHDGAVYQVARLLTLANGHQMAKLAGVPRYVDLAALSPYRKQAKEQRA
jgi:hypothetical protein